ncbi:MAG: OmpA family protein [Muribaculaceae bacterium]|nr:OmpA family protein [Muribaculaceae bacterium]
MKKTFLLTAIALGVAASASAQSAIEESKVTDNISIGLKGGVATPINQGPFFGNMRGLVGAEIRKGITPTFGIGVEGEATVNSSSWAGPKSSAAFDHSYVGAFGTVNLMNLFAGYTGSPRVFEIEVQAGPGWLHSYFPKGEGRDYNTVGAKAGMNFNFNLGESKAWTISLSPAVLFNMKDHTDSPFYGSHRAQFDMTAGIAYHFLNSNGTHSFVQVQPYDAAQVAALNEQINQLRAETAGLAATAQTAQANANILAQKLQECQNRPAQVIKEVKVDNTLQSVRYVFFRVGSSKVTADQQPNVEMIASYMKNHPKSTVVIKGYASPEGNAEFNAKLAASRAESVKNALVSKYGIKASRIKAEGEGIGHMFSEDSWNRVSICTLEE